jgi:hypothetical protein
LQHKEKNKQKVTQNFFANQIIALQRFSKLQATNEKKKEKNEDKFTGVMLH